MYSTEHAHDPDKDLGPKNCCTRPGIMCGFLSACRPSLAKFSNRKGLSSPSETTTQADPVPLHTSEDKVQSGFNVSTKEEGSDGRDTAAMEGNTNRGFLGDFVEQAGSDLGAVMEEDKISSTGSRDQLHNGSLDTKPSGVRKNSGHVGREEGNANQDFPDEPGYLEHLLKAEGQGSSDLLPNTKEERDSEMREPDLHQKQAASFEDTLGPWKAEKVRPTTAPSEEVAGGPATILSPPKVDLSDDGVRDSGVGTASEVRLGGEWSDEDGVVRFGRGRERRSVEEAEELGTHGRERRGGGDGWDRVMEGEEAGFRSNRRRRSDGAVVQQGHQGPRRRGRGEVVRGGQQDILSDGDQARSPYDYGYEEPGTVHVVN